MADATSIKADTFGDIVSIVANRANIAGTVQDRDLNFIKGAVNEYYVKICTERNWHWRKFDRDFVFDVAINNTANTVSVVSGSRTVTFSNALLDNTFVGRTFRVTGTDEIYTIIGIGSTTVAYLSSAYVGDTNALANYKIFQFEFPLPPDCDTINQVYVDNAYYSNQPDLKPVSPTEFNRFLANNSFIASTPRIWCRDGKVHFETYPPLDVMVLDYDFLAGQLWEKVDRLRIWPIEPDKKRLVHINYSIHVEPMKNDDDKPIMPVDDRWILIHFALSEWFAKRGSEQIASREFRIAEKMLKEMRAEHKKSESHPKVIINKSRFSRHHGVELSREKDLFYISRIGESNG